MLFASQRQLLETFSFTADECRRILWALQQRHVPELAGEAQQKALKFITTSWSVHGFLEQEANELDRLLSEGGYRRRVVVGDFGAGKTHIKTFLLNHVREGRFSQDVAPVVIDVPRTGQGFDFYRSLLLFRRAGGETKGYRTVYSDIISRLHEEVSQEMQAHPWAQFKSHLRDWWFSGSSAEELIRRKLIDHGFSRKFSSALLDLAWGTADEHEDFLDVLDQELIQGGDGGEDLFVLVRKLLARVGYKGVIILLDEFGRLEQEAWNGMRQTFAEEISAFHNSLQSLLSEESPFAVYLALFTPGSFWIGHVTPNESGEGPTERKGLQSQANARALFDRLSGSEFSIPDLKLTEIEELAAKILALYEASEVRVESGVADHLPELAKTVYDGLKENDFSISARWALDGIFQEIGSLIGSKKGS